MSDEHGQIWIVFNGEIYNFPELRERLVAGGYRFRTRSDTEVIVALYATEGESFVEKLNGIFAFALWDERQRTLILVRDRVGVKPLYVWNRDGLVAAASEIKSLLAHPDIPREVDTETIPEYLAFRQIAGRKTMFRGIEALGQGEMMVVRNGSASIRRYWSLPDLGHEDRGSEADCLERLHELLRDATHMQLISDVPLGTYNSGGVDSSLVTSYVAEKTGADLNTFCIGLSDPRLDERGYAQLVADKYRTHHRTLLVDDRKFSDCLADVVWHLDEPLTHPNTVAIYLLSRMVKEHVTVVLTGEGCDEFFAGYPRYRMGSMLQAVGGAGPILGRFARMLPERPGRLGKMIAALAAGPERTIMEAARYVTRPSLEHVVPGDASALTEARHPGSSRSSDLVSRMLEQDQRNYLLPILTRLDKATMASSLEARVPFLDHRIVEFAAAVPLSLKLRRAQNKYLVKQLALRRLPREIVYRRKSGLALPLGAWFRNPDGLGRYLDMLVEPRSLQRGYLDAGGIRRVVEEHRGGQDHAELLWGLCNLELWQRTMIDALAGATPDPGDLRASLHEREAP